MELDWARGDTILADGVEVAHADRAWLRERAELQVGPDLWHFRSEGWGRGTLLGERDGTTRFTARRSGFLASRWTIDVGTQLVLTQAGLFSSRLKVSRGGSTIGEVTRSGLFSNRPRLSLTDDLDTSAGCFVLWVAYVELNRQSSNAGGASAGATG